MDAILTATLQVLAVDGAALTTTRVAAVAGVAVGTLYQYFPNRDALLTGVLADHLEAAIGAVEGAAAAAKAEGLTRAAAAERIVRAFLAVKADRAPDSVLLDRVFGAGRLDERPVVAAATRRGTLAVAKLLRDPPDAAALQRAGMACAALEGIVRAVLAEDPLRLADRGWQDQVVVMTVAALR